MKQIHPAYSATVREVLLHLNAVFGSIIIKHFRVTGGPIEMIPTGSKAQAVENMIHTVSSELSALSGSHNSSQGQVTLPKEDHSGFESVTGAITSIANRIKNCLDANDLKEVGATLCCN